jgi:sucrose-6-phosphate hydrolase SacC (GH32 family)
VEPFSGYLMAHFTGESANGEQLYFAHSRDGMRWTDLNRGAPVLLSTVGTRGVRDPALVRSPAGDRYWIIATDLRIASGTSWNDAANRGSKSLVVWESTDLVNWSAPRLLNVAAGISGAGNAWAPEAIYNPATGDYVVYWATNSARNGITKHRIWYARTSDFRSVTSPQLYIDRGSGQGIIDTQIIEVSNSVGGYRYYRASADGHITIEASNSILDSWTILGNLSHMGISNGTGGGNVVEGPMWAQFNGRDEWALWLDQYQTSRGYMPITSTDLGSTRNFRTRSDYSLGTNRKRHGSILNLTAAEESRVLTRWGTPTTGNDVKLVNRNSGKVLDVSGGSTADGAAIVQQADTGAASQRWQVVDSGGGYVKLVNRNSGKVLDVNARSTADGAAVIQYRDNGGTNQSWQLVTSGGYTKLVNRNSGKVLDVYQRSTADGAAVMQWTDNGGANQQWTLSAG